MVTGARLVGKGVELFVSGLATARRQTSPQLPNLTGTQQELNGKVKILKTHTCQLVGLTQGNHNQAFDIGELIRMASPVNRLCAGSVSMTARLIQEGFFV